MYLAYWNLARDPFALGTDRRQMFRAAICEEALSRLGYLAAERRRLGLLLGTSGAGKTIVLDEYATAMRRAGRTVVRLNLASRQLIEWLTDLAAQLDALIWPVESVPQLWRRIEDALAAQAAMGRDTVVLVDDLHHALEGSSAHLLRLAHVAMPATAGLTIVVSTSRQLLAHMDQYLRELVYLRVELETWTIEEMTGYIEWALAQAGRTQPVFGQAALEQLFELSAGVPRRVQQLAELALVAGAAQQLSIIDAETIGHVYHELAGAIDLAPEAIQTAY